MTDADRKNALEPLADEMPAGDDDIEILEVTGAPEDTPPPTALGADPTDGDHPRETDEPDTADGGGEGEDNADLKQRIAALEEDLLRARAEFDNYRKRQERERGAFSGRVAAETVQQLLPVVDNFKRAMEAEAGSADAGDGFRQGMELIYRQLMGVLERAGLAAIDTVGQPFDPNLHEAVARQPADDVEENTITAELEPGYMFRDRLLRPARVCVAMAPDS